MENFISERIRESKRTLPHEYRLILTVAEWPSLRSHLCSLHGFVNSFFEITRVYYNPNHLNIFYSGAFILYPWLVQRSFFVMVISLSFLSTKYQSKRFNPHIPAVLDAQTSRLLEAPGTRTMKIRTTKMMAHGILQMSSRFLLMCKSSLLTPI